MVVWIVNPFDNLPLEGYRPQRYWLMARAFVRAGHTVTVWTSDFSHALKAKRILQNAPAPEPDGTIRTEEGFRVVLIGAPPYRRNISLTRVRSHRILAKRWLARAASEPPPDVTIASSPPLSLCAAVRRFCADRRLPFVIDVMDAWPENFERVVPRWILTPLRRAARANYRGATAITVVAERYADLVKAYGATAPVGLFHHGIERDEPLPRAAEPPSGLTLAYVGNMGKSYDLETVIEAVKSMADVRLELAGAGPDEARLRERAGTCERIRFRSQLDGEALRAMLAACDAGVVPMFADACVGIPYKLADYAAAGLPVLNTLQGEAEKLIAACGAGITYRTGSPEAFRAAVEQLKRADRARMTDGARKLAERFDAQTIYPAFVSFVEANAGKRR